MVVCAFNGCSSPSPQILDPDLFYKRDVAVEVNGVEFRGVTVLPRAPSYDLLVKPKGEMSLLLVTTCHREESFNPGSHGFLSTDNTFRYLYTPQKGLEDVDSCPLRIDAFDKKLGQHSWFFADFEGPEKLEAEVVCNGVKKTYRGVSVCQSKAGLIQTIQLKEPVILSVRDPKCPFPGSDGGGFFEYRINQGECAYAFMTMGGELHRHTTIGYTGVLVRDNPEN